MGMFLRHALAQSLLRVMGIIFRELEDILKRRQNFLKNLLRKELKKLLEKRWEIEGNNYFSSALINCFSLNNFSSPEVMSFNLNIFFSISSVPTKITKGIF